MIVRKSGERESKMLETVQEIFVPKVQRQGWNHTPNLVAEQHLSPISPEEIKRQQTQMSYNSRWVEYRASLLAQKNS